MVLVNCVINLITIYYIYNATDPTKTHVSLVTLSVQDVSKLIQQVKSGFKRIKSINQ